MAQRVKKKTEVVFVVPYPKGVAPSQRFRFEHYYPYLESAGVSFQVASFFDKSSWNNLYLKGKIIFKIWSVLKGYLKRFLLLFQLYKYHFVFVHREATPLGPPVVEWIIAKILRRKIIYDFDDAIWLPATSSANKLARFFKNPSKVKRICKWSYKVSCGNTYLGKFASRVNGNVIILPTVVNTNRQHNKIKSHKTRIQPVVGWTGTHSTLPYLMEIIPILKKVQEEIEFSMHIICNRVPNLDNINFQYFPWNRETEITDLLRFDVGLMPLTDDRWAKGKCGFKAIQYLSLGIPTLASPFGVNTEIVKHAKSGYHCSTTKDWEDYLKELLKKPELRQTMGKVGRNHIIHNYSVKATINPFLNLFEE